MGDMDGRWAYDSFWNVGVQTGGTLPFTYRTYRHKKKYRH